MEGLIQKCTQYTRIFPRVRFIETYLIFHSTSINHEYQSRKIQQKLSENFETPLFYCIFLAFVIRPLKLRDKQKYSSIYVNFFFWFSTYFIFSRCLFRKNTNKAFILKSHYYPNNRAQNKYCTTVFDTKIAYCFLNSNA